MGVRDLQEFLEADCQAACKPVDLLKIARTYQAKRPRGKNPGRLRLVVDAESCLDRLYGGFYSDWACGGQWNRMTNFVSVLMQACQSTNMELVVFFNGATETERLSEWADQMVADKKKVASVLKHIHHKATPPPKVWWISPVCLRQCLRMVLRQMGVAVACSMDDHHQEVIAYCRENSFHGLIAHDSEYAIFDPPRYFSSQNLKLTYRQALETKEYVMEEVAKQWDLTPKRFCIMAALLGNHILTENDLTFFYESVTIPSKRTQADRIRATMKYVRELKTDNDLDEVAKDVFSASRLGKIQADASVQEKFKKSVQYYMNGTQEGFLNYKPKVSALNKQSGNNPAKAAKANNKKSSTPPKKNEDSKDEEKGDGDAKVLVNGTKEKDDDPAADEEDEEEKDDDEKDEVKDLNADSVYIDRESGYANPEIVIDAPVTTDKEISEGMSKLLLDDDENEKKEDKVDDVEDKDKKDKEDKMEEEKGEVKNDEETHQDAVKPEDEKPEDVKTVVEKTEVENKTEDVTITNEKTEDDKTESDNKTEDDKTESDNKTEDDKTENVKIKFEKTDSDEKTEDDSKPEDDSKTEDKQTEDIDKKIEDVKIENTKIEEKKTDVDSKTEAEKTEDNKTEKTLKDTVNDDDKDSTPKQDSTEEETKGEVKVPSVSSTSSSASSTPGSQGSPAPEAKPSQDKKGHTKQSGDHKVPQIAPEIMRIASERHQKGLMAPWVYQILAQGELKLGVTMEDESNRDLPMAVELFRPIRQNIYAILFDVNKRRPSSNNNDNNKSNLLGANKEVIIKEWTLPRGSSTPRVDQVRAKPLDWKVPTVRRLWLGQAIEDKNRRLRALLTCLRSDTPRMLNTSYVPQHLLIMTCILRYMVLHKDVRVLRKHELDAFLCASVSPLLHDVETMQEMKLPMITSRGVQLAALFMRGVEAAIFANDACGSPIPWSMCGPWHFFDGKLFHFKLLKANNNTALLDICDGHMEQMMRVERLRSAILDGIPPDSLFARQALPVMQQPQYGGGGFFHPANNMAFRPAGASPNLMAGPMGGPMERGGRGRGLLGRSPVDSRGGQLQIAGVVVGNWGANVQANQARPGHRSGNVAPPHVTAVGPRRGGMMGGAHMRGRMNGTGRGMMRGGATGMVQRPGSAGRGYNTKSQNGMQRSNITGMKSGIRNSAPPMRGGSGGGSNTGATRGGKSRVRGPAGYNPSSSKVILAGRGRGMTVENPVDSSVVSVSQLMASRTEKGQGDDRDFGQFMDVVEQPVVKHAEVKVNLDQDDDLGMGGESTL